MNSQTESKIRSIIETLAKKNYTELTALEKRLLADREDLLKVREKELEKVNSKFKVFRIKLENNHNTDFIKEEKRLRNFNPCSNYLARLA